MYSIPPETFLAPTNSVIDFTRSYITWQTREHLFGRWHIESACHVYDREQKEIGTWYLVSGVMACSVLQGEKMITDPAYIFQAVFSQKDFQVYRISQGKAKVANASGLNASGFMDLQLHIIHQPSVQLQNETITTATLQNKQLQASVNIQHVATGCTYLMEFPVKHINVSNNPHGFQVETGQVILPYPAYTSVSSFHTAYIACNHEGEINLIFADKKTNLYTNIIQTKAVVMLHSTDTL